MASSLITMTTDFGARDAYVATMKGVILGINPQASIIDITHQVPAQDIAYAAFVLGAAYSYFPKGTIHVVVVDPGVGTSRKLLLLVTPQAMFLAPDNGSLTYVLMRYGAKSIESEGFMTPVVTPVPKGCEAYALSNPRFWHHPVSNTFHGRDILAPIAGHISFGVPPYDLGEPVESLTCLNATDPSRIKERILGRIIHIDHFGNLVSNIPAKDIKERQIRVSLKGHQIAGLSPSYAEGGEVLAIVGSHGYLEISVRNGSAQALLGGMVGDKVEVLLQS